MIRFTIEVDDVTSYANDEYVIQRNSLNSESCCDEVVTMMADILKAMGYHQNSIADSFASIAEEIAPPEK